MAEGKREEEKERIKRDGGEKRQRNERIGKRRWKRKREDEKQRKRKERERGGRRKGREEERKALIECFCQEAEGQSSGSVMIRHLGAERVKGLAQGPDSSSLPVLGLEPLTI